MEKFILRTAIAVLIAMCSAPAHAIMEDKIDGVWYTINEQEHTHGGAKSVTAYVMESQGYEEYKGDIVIKDSFLWNRPPFFKDLPVNVIYISASAFKNCTEVTSVSIPDGMKIENMAFYGCTSLKSITLNRCRIIGAAFGECTGLTQISLNNCTVGQNAFYNCNNLETVEIKGETTLENEAFEGCTALSELFLPKTCIVNDNPFQKSSGLKSITVEDGNSSVKSIDNKMLISLADYTLIQYASANESSTVSIPDGIKKIGEYAFYNSANLRQIDIPNSVENMSYAAFNNCSALTDITIPESVTTLPFDIFNGTVHDKF